MLPAFEPDRAPITRPLRHACESCGATGGLVIFVPNHRAGGRRLCADCLRVVDALRAPEVAGRV